MTLPASAILDNIANTALADPSAEAMTLGEFVERLGEKSLPLATLIFTLPNLFSIPGVSSLLSLIMSFFIVQMMVGRSTIWLPAWLANRTLPEKVLALAIRKSTPVLRKVEKFSKPRLGVLMHPLFRAVICVGMLVLCAIIFLPLSVVGNLLPAICIAFILLGMLERDGLWVLLGAVSGALVVAGLYWVVMEAMHLIIAKVLS